MQQPIRPSIQSVQTDACHQEWKKARWPNWYLRITRNNLLLLQNANHVRSRV